MAVLWANQNAVKKKKKKKKENEWSMVCAHRASDGQALTRGVKVRIRVANY